MVLVQSLLTPCLIRVHITCKGVTTSCLKVAGQDQSLLSPLTQQMESALSSTEKSSQPPSPPGAHGANEDVLTGLTVLDQSWEKMLLGLDKCSHLAHVEPQIPSCCCLLCSQSVHREHPSVHLHAGSLKLQSTSASCCHCSTDELDITAISPGVLAGAISVHHPCDLCMAGYWGAFLNCTFQSMS